MVVKDFESKNIKIANDELLDASTSLTQRQGPDNDTNELTRNPPTELIESITDRNFTIMGMGPLQNVPLAWTFFPEMSPGLRAGALN